MIVTSATCFIWFAALGGIVIDLELSSAAQDQIVGTGLSDHLYATLAVTLEPTMVWVLSIIVVAFLVDLSDNKS